LTSRTSVVIVGGGIAGLCAAYELSGGGGGPSASTPRIELLDSGTTLGGSIGTTTFAGRTIDLGADGFLGRRPEAVGLARDLGLGDTLEPVAASGASIYLNGSIDTLPSGLVLGVPTSSKSLRSLRGLPRGAKFQAWRDEHAPRSYVAKDDATIGTILREKLGGALTYQLIEPMIGGIQAGRVDELSAKSVFPALLAAAQRKGSLLKHLRTANEAMPGPEAMAKSTGAAFYSLTGGVGSLVVALTAVLAERGVVLRTASRVTALRRTPSSPYAWEVDTAATSTPAHVVVMATPASVTASLVGAYHEDLAALRTIRNVGTAMITLQFAPSALALPTNGTGLLIPLGSTFGDDIFLSTAITFLDRKWPHLRSSDDMLLRIHVGRSDDRRFSLCSDDALIDRVLDELRALFGAVAPPLAAMVQRWPEGLPQYLLGHEEVVTRAKAAASAVGIVLAGNAYDGVGIPATIGSGRAAGRSALTTRGLD
jgi:oxygen-dependent protoporphyrinogen oxidase